MATTYVYPDSLLFYHKAPGMAELPKLTLAAAKRKGLGPCPVCYPETPAAETAAIPSPPASAPFSAASPGLSPETTTTPLALLASDPGINSIPFTLAGSPPTDGTSSETPETGARPS